MTSPESAGLVHGAAEAEADAEAARPGEGDPGAPEDHTTTQPRRGTTARAIGWGRASAQRASAWTLDARETHRSVDVGFRLADRDKRVAAGVLAGGVAYRMFFWLLSVSVLATGAFGLVDREWVDRTMSDLGLGPLSTDAVKSLLSGAEHGRWWIILVGGWLVMWTGYLGAKALVLVHAAVWGVAPGPAKKPWVMSLTFTATVAVFVAAMSVAVRLHAEGNGVMLVADIVSTAIPFAIWLLVSHWLPHRGVGWKGLVPGALLVGVGVQACYLFATWFLAPKLANATQLYGILGISATILFWLYVLCRLIIAAATLNASLDENRSAAAPPDGE